MPRKSKSERDRSTEADDLLLRALRQLADETLEEEVPERLLRTLREAQSRQQASARPPPGTDRRCTPESPGGSADQARRSRRRAGSS